VYIFCATSGLRNFFTQDLERALKFENLTIYSGEISFRIVVIREQFKLLLSVVYDRRKGISGNCYAAKKKRTEKKQKKHRGVKKYYKKITNCINAHKIGESTVHVR